MMVVLHFNCNFDVFVGDSEYRRLRMLPSWSLLICQLFNTHIRKTYFGQKQSVFEVLLYYDIEKN